MLPSIKTYIISIIFFFFLINFIYSSYTKNLYFKKHLINLYVIKVKKKNLTMNVRMIDDGDSRQGVIHVCVKSTQTRSY